MKNVLESLVRNDNYIFINESKNLTFNKSGKFYLFEELTNSCDINLTINKMQEVTIYECINLQKDINVNYNIICEEDAKVNIISIYENASGKQQIKVSSILKENAYLNSMKLSLFSDEVDFKCDVLMEGMKSTNNDYSIIINTCKRKQAYSFLVTHKTNETKSEMRNYVICKNESLVDINTNGVVLQGAKQSSVNQKTKGILLSLESGISANPLLQIDEFDCLASHGAGIGAIDEEDLFYLMCRGLTRDESEKLIVEGFINPIYKALENEKVCNDVAEEVSKVTK